jgi:translation initiation factor 4A
MTGKRKIRNPVFIRKGVSNDKLVESLAALELSPEDEDESTILTPTFEDMDLDFLLLKGIKCKKYKEPAPIQQRAIIPCIQGRDAVLQAQSGMGKTAVLCISILQRIQGFQEQNCQALVIAPTRELSLQITEVFKDLGQFMSINVISCTGGTRTKQDKLKLTHPTVRYPIVVGTLGRILSLARTNFLNTSANRIFAMDEADKMLTDNKFRKDIAELLSEHVGADAQVILMSATMPSLAMDRANEFLRSPVLFLLNNDELTLEGIKQYHIDVDTDANKIATLLDLGDVIAEHHCLLFCNSRNRVTHLTKELIKGMGDDFSATHGILEQEDRTKALQDFRSGISKLLITSDLLGRGIDVKEVSMVINYDLPSTVEEYIHRVGRGGRFGRKGIAITFIRSDQMEDLKTIAKFYNTNIPPMPANMYSYRSGA